MEHDGPTNVVILAEVNHEADRDLAKHFGVSVLPTFCWVSNGVVVARWTPTIDHLQDGHELRKFLASLPTKPFEDIPPRHIVP